MKNKTEQLVRRVFCLSYSPICRKRKNDYTCRCCAFGDWQRVARCARAFVKAENKQKEPSKIPSYTYKVYSLKDIEKIGLFAKANQLKMIREGVDFPGKNLIIKMRSKRKGKREKYFYLKKYRPDKATNNLLKHINSNRVNGTALA